MKTLEELKKEAEGLAGRALETETLKDGKILVSWFSFKFPPPPSSETEEGAYQNFIEYMNSLKEKGHETEDDRA